MLLGRDYGHRVIGILSLATNHCSEGTDAGAFAAEAGNSFCDLCDTPVYDEERLEKAMHYYRLIKP